MTRMWKMCCCCRGIWWECDRIMWWLECGRCAVVVGYDENWKGYGNKWYGELKSDIVNQLGVVMVAFVVNHS